MKIHECLLDNDNGVVIDGDTLGGMIASSGKRHLWSERVDGRIDTVVIHYMSAVNVDKNHPYDLDRLLKIFCDFGVSSHYLITRRGRIFRLVPEEAKAWHAGLSMMPEPDNRSGVNEFSIGIELMATEDSGFTKLQYSALRELCLDIEKRCGRGMTYVGHDQIAGERAVALGVRADRKVDPGPMFDWDFFRKSLSR
jgi:N-acetyl-anhydromuramyl-L-alanine amidase AmpD